MEIYRDVSSDFLVQVTDTNARILRLTVGFIGALFLIFAGFVSVADIFIYRANRREVALVEGQLAEREEAARALSKSEGEANRLAEQNAVLAEVGRIVSSSLDIDQVYDRFAGQARKLIPFDRIVVTVLDPDGLSSTASYASGVEIPGWETGSTHVVQGTLTEAVLHSRSGLICSDSPPARKVKGFAVEDRPLSAGLRSMMEVPLISNDRAIGTLTMRSTAPDAYSEEHLALGDRIGVQIGGAVANAQLYAQHKEAEEALARQARELARSNAELEQFAYIASHDLQEPLRMVTAYTQLLAKRYEGKLDADAQEFIGYAADGATRMQELISDLLAYSRVGTEGKEFEPTDCEVVLDRTLSNLQGAIDESGAVVGHDALPTVLADPLQMGQLLQNLVGNAIKYRNERAPEVHVGAERDGDEWRISVRDNGIGIAPEHRERVFVVFQRLHSRDEYPGTGIGLGLCKKIVERHEGRIWVESEVGKGSTFFFTVPLRGGD